MALVRGIYASKKTLDHSIAAAAATLSKRHLGEQRTLTPLTKNMPKKKIFRNI